LKRLLIANRGEIAIRITRTARKQGIHTIGLAGPGDENSRHARILDETHAIDSYINQEAILAVAAATGAEAVHPGYGFLSERDTFADGVREAGMLFVGPPGAAMRRLGNKIAAKELATESGVPVLPGYFRRDATDAELRAAAITAGFPVLLKASAGGGGRGMRVVHNADEFDAQLPIARDEAARSFGDGSMMVERYVAAPRHIETQFLADAHGNVAVLFERECSIQRRHQKLIEEAPAARMGFDWQAMRAATIRLVKAAGYVGAGTAEFLVDATTGEFFFLEVNARLQVEHPVTELITGLDLVAWQLRIAEGSVLDLAETIMAGNRLAIRGHAIEARIIAEDPERNFLPSIGLIKRWAQPNHPNVRIDAGFEEGDAVSSFYDSMVAKVIAHGETRRDAIDTLDAALADFHVLGIATNIGFIRDLLADEEFRLGNLDTGFFARFMERRPTGVVPSELGDLVRFATVGSGTHLGSDTGAEGGPWAMADGWRGTRTADS
jgi:3-methylcrotonyl-CoA carboxylase alpha subunit